jgi:hypothetical protein
MLYELVQLLVRRLLGRQPIATCDIVKIEFTYERSNENRMHRQKNTHSNQYRNRGQLDCIKQ